MENEISIGIVPGFEELTLVPGEKYQGTFSVVNPSSVEGNSVDYRIIVTPFSVTDENYNIDFTKKTEYTDIVDWITIEEKSGTLAPEELKEIHFTIDVPQTAKSGGQYASIMARIDNPEKTNDNSYSIMSRSQVAMILYAAIDTELVSEGTILENKIPTFSFDSPISVTSRISNNGNIHSKAINILRVENAFTGKEYYSSVNSPKTNSILPGTELLVVDTWEETPALGVFRVVQSISYNNKVDTSSGIVFVCPIWFLIIWLIFIGSCFAWFFSHRHETTPKEKSNKNPQKPLQKNHKHDKLKTTK